MTSQMRSQTQASSTSRKRFRGKTVSDLARIAELAGITIRQAWQVREAMAKVMAEALIRRERITIRGFGTFSHWKGKDKKRGDPNYGGYRILPGKWKVRFTPHSALNYLLNPQEYKDADKQPGNKEDSH